MAERLQITSLSSPGFYGLNTQDSGLESSPSFALRADNAIIDKFGRIGVRNGWTTFSNESNDVTGSVGAIEEHVESDGTLTVLFAANNKLWKITDSAKDPVELTPNSGTAITITDDNWQIVSYNNISVFVQQDHTMVYYDGSADEYFEFTDAPASTTPSCVAACFNRLWIADGSVVYWSQILEPTDFANVGSGFINMREIFGEDDEVTGITEHNNKLIIFGKRNTAVFVGGEDPTGTSFAMLDHISGIGCIARDSIANVGTDVFFLSAEGLRTLGRTIQENSSPVRDVSRNIRDDLLDSVSGVDPFTIKSVYSPNDAFYVLSIASAKISYVFDLRSQLQDGSLRTTTWTQINPTAWKLRRDNTLLLGQVGYVGKYNGFSDNGEDYKFQYYTTYLDFGNPVVEKILKKLKMVIFGSSAESLTILTGTNYSTRYTRQSIPLTLFNIAEFGTAEFGTAEFSAGEAIQNIGLNLQGKGSIVQFGFELNINGNKLSFQKLDVYSKTGKLIS